MRGLDKLQELLTPQFLATKKDLIPVFKDMKNYFGKATIAYQTNVYMMYTESKFDSTHRYPATGSIIACGLFAFHYSNFASWDTTGEKIIAMKPTDQWNLKLTRMLKGRKIVDCYAYNMAFNYLPTLADALEKEDLKFQIAPMYTVGLSNNGMSSFEYVVFSALIPMVTAMEFTGLTKPADLHDYIIDYRSDKVRQDNCFVPADNDRIAEKVDEAYAYLSKMGDGHKWGDWRTILYAVQKVVGDTEPTALKAPTHTLSTKTVITDASAPMKKGSEESNSKDSTPNTIMNELMSMDDANDDRPNANNKGAVTQMKTFSKKQVVKDLYLKDFVDDDKVTFKSKHLNGKNKIIETTTVSKRFLTILANNLKK